jgi:murein L,D-transpeptidase YcbB/YkuD
MNIARRDILPKAQRDPQYLVKNRIRVFESWQDRAPEIRPQLIDWLQVAPSSLSFKFRQDPGPMNALGRLKFMFPNKFNVYLHDTPSRELFGKAARSFSSGCIRIEKPVDLAEHLLRGDDRWSRERLLSVIESGETQVVPIPEPIPVHLLYWTAWVDSRGIIHFRDDIYGRDEPLDRALKAHPPKS